MVKVAVVTCVFLLDFDEIDTPSCNFKKCPNFDYFLFTNDKSKVANLCNDWSIIEVKSDNVPNGVYLTKYVKWQTHECLPEYDIIIWVDSFIIPNYLKTDEINTIIEKCLNDDLNTPIFMRTQKFTCIKDDIDWCVKNKRLTKQLSDKIVNYINTSENFSVETPVQTYWSSAIIKSNKNIKLKNMSVELFKYITDICYRDQHILPVLLHKHNIKCNIIPSTHYTSDKEIFINNGKQNVNNHNYSDKIN